MEIFPTLVLSSKRFSIQAVSSLKLIWLNRMMLICIFLWPFIFFNLFCIIQSLSYLVFRFFPILKTLACFLARFACFHNSEPCTSAIKILIKAIWWSSRPIPWQRHDSICCYTSWCWSSICFVITLHYVIWRLGIMRIRSDIARLIISHYNLHLLLTFII